MEWIRRRIEGAAVTVLDDDEVIDSRSFFVTLAPKPPIAFLYSFTAIGPVIFFTFGFPSMFGFLGMVSEITPS